METKNKLSDILSSVKSKIEDAKRDYMRSLQHEYKYEKDQHSDYHIKDVKSYVRRNNLKGSLAIASIGMFCGYIGSMAVTLGQVAYGEAAGESATFAFFTFLAGMGLAGASYLIDYK
jgi:hypothetical protein